MLGLDDWISGFSDGASAGVVLLIAVLLGLRHAADPDHVAAVATLIASGKERGDRLAARLGAAWGLGHALSLFAFGVPIVLYERFLPDPLQKATEATIGAVIVALALWLLLRWRRGVFHVHLHGHDGQGRHVHGHTHAPGREHPHRHVPKPRGARQAFGIGLVHGVGGSAGVGVLLLATMESQTLAVLSLGLLALFTAVSMALLSTGFGLTLQSVGARRSFNAVAPVLGCASLAFGVWYALGALELAPYYL
ncbi:MAG: hypothetical protein ABR521_11120 [Gaiellaceae bacterium]